MRDLAKAAFCGLNKYSGLVWAQELLASWLERSSMAVLLFHRVIDDGPEDGMTVSTRRFRLICRMLQRRFRTVPLGEIFRIARSGEPAPRRTIAITFDDSYHDNLCAARVLAEHGLPACFFIPTSYVGTNKVYDWDQGRARMPNLTWDDVREMDRLGFEIGSHTVTHPNLATVSREQVRRELTESKQIIEKQLGKRVRWFAYPFGGSDNFRFDYLPLVEEAGYDGCCSGFGGFIYRHCKASILPRQSGSVFGSVINLEVHLTGRLNWYYALKRRFGWLDVSGGLPSPSTAPAGQLLAASEACCQNSR